MDKHNDRFGRRAAELVSCMTLDEKIGFLITTQRPVERLGIDEFNIGTEVARGFVSRTDGQYSTVFPQPIGLAGTFDPELMEEIGRIAGREARAYFNCGGNSELCFWGPTVDMERDPRWGRTEEAYGEDVCLAGEMTAAYTRGLAGDDDEYMMTIPALKHFCANNNEDERLKSDSYLPPRLKHEYYYAAFMNAIRYGKARSIMTCYNSVNGVPGLCNPDVKRILKDEWGIWFAVTDGMDFCQNIIEHEYCDTHSETLAESLLAGCDVMTDNDSIVAKAAFSALEKGLLTEEDIDRAVENTLYARLRLGHIDGGPFENITTDIVDSEESRKVSLRAAREQIVLLKNDGILPMRAPDGAIAVVGPLCDRNYMDWYCGIWREDITPADGIKQQYPGNEIICDRLWDIAAIKAPNGKYISAKADGTVRADSTCITEAEEFEIHDWGNNWINLYSVKFNRYIRVDYDGMCLHNDYILDWFTFETLNLFRYGDSVLIEEYLWHKRLTTDETGRIFCTDSRTADRSVMFSLEMISRGKDRAADIARCCGQVIYCTGNHPMQPAREGYDRKTLSLLTGNHSELLDALLENNPRTVMALVSSYPYSICDEHKKLPGIIYSSHAGPYLGTALAETIKGNNPPSGRLAMTWYRSELDLPDITDYDIEKNGTTYMYFRGDTLYPFGYGLSYADIEYNGIEADEHGAEITLRNVSDTDSDEVVQLYFTVMDSAVTRPIKKLCGFSRVHLRAGEEKKVRIDVPEHILQIYDVRTGKMITESGRYVFMAGGSSGDLPLMTEAVIAGSTPGIRGVSFAAESFDSADGVRIRWSRRLKRHYLYFSLWYGYSRYGGIVFRDRKYVRITASCLLGNRELKICIGSEEQLITLNGSNGYDDFSDYLIPIPDGVPDTGEITFWTGMGTAILDISLE